MNEPGRNAKVKLKLPGGISYRNVPGSSLNEMLLEVELDAVMYRATLPRHKQFLVAVGQ